jgi:BlaI family transcriptional regulator, penicillinase repressor
MESPVAERISEAELEVMEALWSAGEPLTAADVADRIGPDRGWSDRTVKTMLARLLAKGALAHEEDGRRYLYRPQVARDHYVAGESRRLLDRLFGGRAAPLVAHLAESEQLTRADLDELEALLKELKA